MDYYYAASSYNYGSSYYYDSYDYGYYGSYYYDSYDYYYDSYDYYYDAYDYYYDSSSYEYGYYDSYDYGPGASSYTEPEPEVVKPDPEVVADPIINDTSKDASVSKDSTSAVITEEGDKSVLKEYKDGEKCEYANECLSTCCFSNNIDWGGKIFDPS
jgi:hypothetical protein